jgi:hypothetical protein
MEIPTKDSTAKEGFMERECMFGQMKIIMMDNSSKAVNTEEAFGNQRSDNTMKDITKMIKKAAVENTIGIMDAYMRENSKMTQSKDLLI